MNQLVSVIVPTYNRSNLLLESTDSVFRQTYRPIELIVVDDGSTDNTREVVNQWNQALPQDAFFQIRYIHQQNRGVSAARNCGIRESNGAYLVFLDSDDLLSPDMLEAATTELRDGRDACLVGGAFISASGTEQNSAIIPTASPDCDPLDNAFQGCNGITTTSWVLHRSLVSRCPLFVEGMSFAEDALYFLHVCANASSVAYVSRPLCYVRMHAAPRLTDASGTDAGQRQMASYYQAAAQLLIATGRGTSTTRSILATKMLRHAVDSWKAIPEIGVQLGSLARELCPAATPGFRRLLPRIAWAVGGVPLCGWLRRKLT